MAPAGRHGAMAFLAGVLVLAGCAQPTPSGPAGAPGEGGWEKLPPPPGPPRTGAVTAWTGSEALFLGGDAGPPCVDTSGCALPPASTVEGVAFDPDGRTWRRTAAAPVPIDPHAPSAVVGTTVHLLTGGTMLSYDAAGDTWTAHPPPPGNLDSVDLAENGGRIVVARSQRAAGDPPDQVYDPAARSWTALPEDPLGPAFDRILTATTAGLVLTGRTLVPDPGSEEPALVRAAVLDPASSRWTLLEDSDQLGGRRWAWTGRRMVDPSLGGADGGSTNNYGRTIPMGGVLDPAIGAWGRLPDAPAARSGGWPVEALGGPRSAAEGWVFDDRQETWTRLPRPEGAPPEPGPAVWAGDLLVVLGGVDPGRGASLEALSGSAWAWSPETEDSGDRPADGAGNDIRGEWHLVEGVRNGERLPLPSAGQGTLVVGDGELSGRSFCNTFGSTYRFRDGELTIDGLGGTEMACVPDVMTAEQAYLAALGAVDTAAVVDGDLLLRGQDTELRFRRPPPEPASDLVGTRWVLDTLVEGEVASSTLGEPAVLVLAADGSLSGSTGCRTLSGRWSRTGDTLVLPELRPDGDCPADVRAQDAHVLAVLDGEASAGLDGDRLTLTAPDGLGLVYRAR